MILATLFAVALSSLSVYLVHGDCDITVPLPSSVRLHETLQSTLGAGHVQFEIIPHMGHASDPLYADAVLDRIDQWIKSTQ